MGTYYISAYYNDEQELLSGLKKLKSDEDVGLNL